MLKTLGIHLKDVFCLLGLGTYVWSGSADNSIIVWDSDTKQPIQELKGYHSAPIKYLCASGANVWSACFDKTVAIWNLKG